MKRIVFASSFILVIGACQTKETNNKVINSRSADSIALINMIQVREKAMQVKDLPTVINQFREDATFINGGGYYFKGRSEIAKFHQFISQTQPGYTSKYQAGKATINILSSEFALAYYPWQIITVKTTPPMDTIKGTGLMTLLAQKENQTWKWRAITNQRTDEYFPNLENHSYNP
ncbi:MAG: nuclear transport factor 2 family protein [Bacteroidota bacterium]|nr:nuclear transport factor 2 family protein [Bacteroidota bacterium]